MRNRNWPTAHCALLAVVALALAMWLMPLQARASKGDFRVEVYRRWAALPTPQLMAMAHDYLLESEKNDSALVCLTIVADRYNTAGGDTAQMRSSVKAMYDLSIMYAIVYYDYQKSYSYLLLAQRLAEQNGYGDILPYIYQQLGGLYSMHDEVVKYRNLSVQTMSLLRRAFYSAIDVKDWDAVILSFNNMADLCLRLDSASAMRPEIAAFRRLNISREHEMARFTYRECDALEASARGDWQAVVAHLTAMLPLINTTQLASRFDADVLIHRAHAYDKIGRRDSTLSDLQRAERIALRDSMQDKQIEVYSLLTDFHRQNGNAAEASRYRMLYLDLKDSLMSASKLSAINKMHFLSELGKADETVRDMRQRDERRNILLVFIGVVAVMASAFVALLLRSNRRLREKNQQLYDQVQRMLGLAEAHSPQDDDKPAPETMQEYVPKNTGGSEPAQEPASEEPPTSASSRLTDEQKAIIMDRVQGVMKDAAIICRDDFTLQSLATITGFPSRQVSQVVNERSGGNFRSMLRDARLREACVRLNDTAHYGNYTIEAIAESIGFKSRTQFAAAFKQLTGLTPSEYQRMARRQ